VTWIKWNEWLCSQVKLLHIRTYQYFTYLYSSVVGTSNQYSRRSRVWLSLRTQWKQFDLRMLLQFIINIIAKRNYKYNYKQWWFQVNVFTQGLDVLHVAHMYKQIILQTLPFFRLVSITIMLLYEKWSLPKWWSGPKYISLFILHNVILTYLDNYSQVVVLLCCPII